MRRFLLLLAAVALAGTLLHKYREARAASALPLSGLPLAPASQPQGTQTLTAEETHAFAALEPIDTHTHVFVDSPGLRSLLRKLHMHNLDICVVDDHSQFEKSLDPQLEDAMMVVRSSEGQSSLCTTFDPFGFRQPGFADEAIRGINQ